MMTRTHVVVLALSTLRKYQVGKPREYSFMVRGFEGEGARERYTGWHTNETPMKLFVDLAIADGAPIDKIVYLRSENCRDEKQDFDGESMTADEYFRSHLRAYLLERGVEGWMADEQSLLVPIDYDLEGPEQSLHDIISAIGLNAVVDVDVSGAQRDAQLLITHAIEFVQAATVGEGGVRLGRTVYASINSNTYMGTLSDQGETYKLSELIGAANAFVRYGRAGTLVDYFGDAGDTAASRLCLAMRDFSDDLLLCRTGDMPERVTEVWRRLDELEESVKEKRSRKSGETLLATLVPNIRAGFVRATDDPNQLAIEIIRWCARRRMLQQALALYRERAPRLMIELRYLENPGNLKGEGLVAAVADLARTFADSLERLMGPVEGKKTKRARQRALRAAKLQSVTKLVPVAGKEAELVANLIWFHYFRTIRNDAMHAKLDTGEDERRELLEHCIAVYEDPAMVSLRYDIAAAKGSYARNQALAEDVGAALDALEGNVRPRIRAELADIGDNSEMTPEEIEDVITKWASYASSIVGSAYGADAQKARDSSLKG